MHFAFLFLLPSWICNTSVSRTVKMVGFQYTRVTRRYHQRCFFVFSLSRITMKFNQGSSKPTSSSYRWVQWMLAPLIDHMPLDFMPGNGLQVDSVPVVAWLDSAGGCFWKSFFSQIDFLQIHMIPQIAIAIGVLTSNRGGGRRTTLAHWTWHQGAIAGCSGRGAIAGCHRRVPL